MGKTYPQKGKPGGNGRSKSREARRLVELIQRTQDQSILAIAGFDAHGGVVGEVCRHRPIRLIKLCATQAHRLLRVSRRAQRAADHRPGCFPGSSLQKAKAGIGVAHTRTDEDIAPTEGPAQSL
jgi:hypothetical protein